MEGADPGADASRIELRFVDFRRAPIPGVTLYRGPTESTVAKLCGGSDAVGRIALTRPSQGVERLLAKHPGFRETNIELRPDSIREIEVQLDHGCEVSGQVFTANGDSVGCGVRVLVYPVGESPSKSELAYALGVEGALPAVGRVAVADDSGRFSLTGLEDGAEFAYVAGGCGWLTMEEGRSQAATNVFLEVRVAPLFGADIERIEPDGSPMRVSPELADTRWTWDSTIARGVPTDSVEALLAGVQLNATSRRGGRRVPMLFVLNSADAALRETFGPIHVMAAAPGYATTELDIEAPRADPGPARVSIVARPAAEFRTGGVRVEFVGATDPAPDVDRVQVAGAIRFVDAATGSTFDYKLDRLPREPIEIAALPEGAYDIALETQLGFHDYAPVDGKRLIVSADTTASRTFDVSWNRSVRFTLGDRVEGFGGAGATLMLEHVYDNGVVASVFITFRRPPYIVDGLLPKAYNATLYKPFLSSPLAFDCREGAGYVTAAFRQ